MSALTERLQTADRAAVVADTVQLIDDEVGRKSGMSGMALKAGYKVVQKLKGGRMIPEAVDYLLDAFTGALSPLYDTFLAQDAISTFEAFIRRHEQEASDALLHITDARAERSDNKVLRSTYEKLRGQAEKHVKEAVPGVGRIIDRHAPKTAA